MSFLLPSFLLPFLPAALPSFHIILHWLTLIPPRPPSILPLITFPCLVFDCFTPFLFTRHFLLFSHPLYTFAASGSKWWRVVKLSTQHSERAPKTATDKCFRDEGDW
jgi:hypothetical protein